MPTELSDRARRYISEWRRLPSVATESEVREALVRAGAPVTEPLLDFHRTFAGYLFDCGLEIAVLGLVHPEPIWMPPNEVEAWEPEPGSPRWKIRCADINPSFWWTIDEEGTYSIAADTPNASSFAMHVEQLALWAEFNEGQDARIFDLTIANPIDLLRETLLPRLQPYLLSELSDRYSQLYATENLLVWVARNGSLVDAKVIGAAEPPEFVGLVLGGG